MSRTTKTLRTYLMTKENAFIWRRARLGVEGLPPMIEDLSEPLYANLLFDKHCHVRAPVIDKRLCVLNFFSELFEDTDQVHSVAITNATLQGLFWERDDVRAASLSLIFTHSLKHGNDRPTYTVWAHRLTQISRRTGSYSAFQAFNLYVVWFSAFLDD